MKPGVIETMDNNTKGKLMSGEGDYRAALEETQRIKIQLRQVEGEMKELDLLNGSVEAAADRLSDLANQRKVLKQRLEVATRRADALRETALQAELAEVRKRCKALEADIVRVKGQGREVLLQILPERVVGDIDHGLACSLRAIEPLRDELQLRQQRRSKLDELLRGIAQRRIPSEAVARQMAQREAIGVADGPAD